MWAGKPQHVPGKNIFPFSLLTFLSYYITVVNQKLNAAISLWACTTKIGRARSARPIWNYEHDYSLYYIHFEITGYPCNLIGSQQCDLFPNRTFFCAKSHLFLSQWEWDSKTKQPIRFQGFLKLTNHIAGKWNTKGHCLATLATFVVLVVLVFRLLNCVISKWM